MVVAWRGLLDRPPSAGLAELNESTSWTGSRTQIVGLRKEQRTSWTTRTLRNGPLMATIPLVIASFDRHPILTQCPEPEDQPFNRCRRVNDKQVVVLTAEMNEMLRFSILLH